jgi:hypothetical protein
MLTPLHIYYVMKLCGVLIPVVIEGAFPREVYMSICHIPSLELHFRRHELMLFFLTNMNNEQKVAM